MDGAGRLAQQQRPQTDLKAAAIGAAVLLREYLGLRRPAKKPIKQPTYDREPPPPCRCCLGCSCGGCAGGGFDSGYGKAGHVRTPCWVNLTE